MAIVKEIVLNKLDVNVNQPHIEVVKRVSFMENGEELSRNHTHTHYDFLNEADLYASESVFIQSVWENVSGSFISTDGNIV